MSYGKAFFAKLFCASKKATVSRAFAKRAPFLLLLSGTKEVNIKNEEKPKIFSQTTLKTQKYPQNPPSSYPKSPFRVGRFCFF
ncbi:hypothetical protein [uncultured Phascolarctobacterium sp.]|uniref:hypothetical protein n=1 Tax=uncultured Phascolarctobacterium sp. TaxID=512296 RepID=UPI0025FEF425|nr:hypothetical protein [uncultured Phascolarctobacterium sp.]